MSRCEHPSIVESRGDIVCTQCGLVLRDDEVPTGWASAAWTTMVQDQPIVSKSVSRQCSLMADALRLPECVATSAGELVTKYGYRSSNVNAVAACLFLAAKRYRLDRLEREVVVSVRGVDNRLFLKYLKSLKAQEADRYVTGVETIKRMVPRIACDLVPDQTKRAKFARALEETFCDLYAQHADTVTPIRILKMSIAQTKLLVQR